MVVLTLLEDDDLESKGKFCQIWISIYVRENIGPEIFASNQTSTDTACRKFQASDSDPDFDPGHLDRNSCPKSCPPISAPYDTTGMVHPGWNFLIWFHRKTSVLGFWKYKHFIFKDSKFEKQSTKKVMVSMQQKNSKVNELMTTTMLVTKMLLTYCHDVDFCH